MISSCRMNGRTGSREAMRGGLNEKGTDCMTMNETYRGAEQPDSLSERLKRVDELHRAITRATGRIEFLKQSAEKANSRLTPVRYGRGVEHSKIEYAVLESDAEQWGITELQRELEKLLKEIRPLVERLPPGVLRAVAVQRILQGVPCGIIAKRMHFCRSYVYQVLRQVEERICLLGERCEN